MDALIDAIAKEDTVEERLTQFKTNVETLRIINGQQKNLKVELSGLVPAGTNDVGRYRVINTHYETTSLSYKALYEMVYDLVGSKHKHLTKEFDDIKEQMTSHGTGHKFEVK